MSSPQNYGYVAFSLFGLLWYHIFLIRDYIHWKREGVALYRYQTYKWLLAILAFIYFIYRLGPDLANNPWHYFLWKVVFSLISIGTFGTIAYETAHKKRLFFNANFTGMTFKKYLTYIPPAHYWPLFICWIVISQEFIATSSYISLDYDHNKWENLLVFNTEETFNNSLMISSFENILAMVCFMVLLTWVIIPAYHKAPLFFREKIPKSAYALHKKIFWLLCAFFPFFYCFRLIRMVLKLPTAIAVTDWILMLYVLLILIFYVRAGKMGKSWPAILTVILFGLYATPFWLVSKPLEQILVSFFASLFAT